MAIEIIRKPTELFTMECEKCECVFTYNRHDLFRRMTLDYVACPCCREEIPHCKRKIYLGEDINAPTKESEGEG
jgi:hypothetical protein